MNRIYSLKFNKKRELVVVSEISGGVKKSARQRSQKPALMLFAVFVTPLFSPFLHASIVGTTIPYQTYRDFAENKGAFTPGATNISLYDQQGNVSAMLSQAPMIDFSAVDKGIAVSALVSPQYIVSVKHNGGYKTVRFGYGDDSSYSLVDRNNSTKDFHTPRLNKIVTEVVPTDVTDAGTARGTYQDQTRFPVFYRVGSGTQYVKNTAGKLTNLASAYSYKIGGTVGRPAISDWSLVSNPGNTYALENAPLASYGTPGDSGSPLFAWDAQRQKWVLVAVLNSYAGNSGKTNWFTVIPVSEVNANIKADTDAPVKPTNSSENIYWKYDLSAGTGTLALGTDVWNMHGKYGDTSAASLNGGKDLAFENSGTVVLENTIDQGAGTLTFNGNYTVKPESDQSWKGGGIIVNGAHTVDWQVNGVAGDSLHKLGTGTLKIAGSGVNPGMLSIGDGTVVLAQRPDKNGQVQAFQSVSIVSGRPTLILSDSQQMNPDNIRWGYHGGKLDINGNNLTFHALKAADDGAILTNSGSIATVNLDFRSSDTATPVTTMFHGFFTGNVDVINSAPSRVQNTFVIDGGINIPESSMTQQGGALYFQGHPVIHAVSSQSIAKKLQALGDNSVLTQPVSFTQNDWQTRQFVLKALNLSDATFNLARNAQLTTTLNASKSSITLGSKDLYIDTNDGNGVKTTPVAGQSSATTQADQSHFNGMVNLTNGSSLQVNEYFNGGVTSSNSRISVASTNALFTRHSTFSHSALTLADNAQLTSYAGLQSDSNVDVGADATLSLLNGQSSTTMPYSATTWNLNGSRATLNVDAGTDVSGDIHADNDVSIHIGVSDGKDKSMFTRYVGDISAPKASVAMNNTQWTLNSKAQIRDLAINNSQIVMVMDGKTSSSITVSDHLTGKDNILYVMPTQPLTGMSTGDIPLITTTKGTDSTFAFKTVAQRVGFHSMVPNVDVVKSGGATHWRLKGFDVQLDRAVTEEGQRVMGISYKNFLSEVNNLNLRMGDLHDRKGETGAWARLMTSSGSGDAGYSDDHTHLHIGADRKHHFDGGDLFTGVTMSVTDSKTRGDSYWGKTRSVGGGLYASVLSDSGLYVDAIGKYVHQRNDSTMRSLGLGKTRDNTHFWYFGTEAGWRYQFKPDIYIESQGQLVYGRVSGRTLNWQYNGMDVSMGGSSANPVIGRTGVEFGKTMSGKTWQVTAKAGIDYQFDLHNTGTTTFRDFAGEATTRNGRDGRMLMNVGLDARIKENTRVSLNVERSAFGKYNVNNAINANLRYTF